MRPTSAMLPLDFRVVDLAKDPASQGSLARSITPTLIAGCHNAPVNMIRHLAFRFFQ